MGELFSRALAEEFRRDLARQQNYQAKARQREATVYDHKPNPREHKRQFLDRESAQAFASTMMYSRIVKLREGYEVTWLTRPSVSASNRQPPAVPAEVQATPLSPGYRVLVQHGQESTPVDHIRCQSFGNVFDACEEYKTACQYNIAWARVVKRDLDVAVYDLEYGFSGRYEKQLQWKEIRIPKMYRTNTPRKRR